LLNIFVRICGLGKWILKFIGAIIIAIRQLNVIEQKFENVLTKPLIECYYQARTNVRTNGNVIKPEIYYMILEDFDD